MIWCRIVMNIVLICAHFWRYSEAAGSRQHGEKDSVNISVWGVSNGVEMRKSCKNCTDV